MYQLFVLLALPNIALTRFINYFRIHPLLYKTWLIAYCSYLFYYEIQFLVSGLFHLNINIKQPDMSQIYSSDSIHLVSNKDLIKKLGTIFLLWWFSKWNSQESFLLFSDAGAAIFNSIISFISTAYSNSCEDHYGEIIVISRSCETTEHILRNLQNVLFQH